MLHNKEEGNLLIDFYGCLLTKHQIDVLNYYFVEDLSMQEISENIGISKSAVSDLINRSYKQLQQYEKKLCLLKQANKIDKLINALENDKSVNEKYIKELKKINRG